MGILSKAALIGAGVYAREEGEQEGQRPVRAAAAAGTAVPAAGVSAAVPAGPGPGPGTAVPKPEGAAAVGTGSAVCGAAESALSAGTAAVSPAEWRGPSVVWAGYFETIAPPPAEYVKGAATQPAGAYRPPTVRCPVSLEGLLAPDPATPEINNVGLAVRPMGPAWPQFGILNDRLGGIEGRLLFIW
ncbi:hypothetical protein V494_01238 [Pseudogymnoascus sp. VKM F-4513 (FW-928)]|nr:hypothetical protein V494_01238 [Pseudogymnoascus sp. VKM F-4513 (FW-928)]